MAKAKGSAKTGGRQKGTANKPNKEIKDMIRGALDLAGGEDYLHIQSEKNPIAFMGLIGKIIPADVRAQIKGELTFKWKDE